MTIQFYLNNEEETYIYTMYDMQSNPFNVGDIIHLSVEELYPIDYNNYKENYRKTMIDDNDKLKQSFHLKEIKIIREGKWVNFKVAKAPHLIIEYHCELITKNN